MDGVISSFLYSELKEAAAKYNEEKISLIFSILDSQMKKEIENSSINLERNKTAWNDPEEHFSRITEEEIYDLKRENNYRLELFKIAKSIEYKPQMMYQFAIALQNIGIIREKRSIIYVKNEIMWSDNNILNELKSIQNNTEYAKDLKVLYQLAEEANFEEGKTIVSDKLFEIEKLSIR